MNTTESPKPSKPLSAAVVILVVLALLTLLAGMLLPSLAKAKAKAHRVAFPVDQLIEVESESSGAGRYGFNTEAYDRIIDNPFLGARENPLSTFGIDVDTASYSNIRRFLNQGRLPPQDAVRIEEMINYFHYRYPQPNDTHPFSVTLEASECPWNREHQLLRIGLKAREITSKARVPCNLVFLVDVSGSMDSPNKLPLLQETLEILVHELSGKDRVAIVVYAGSSGLVLDSTTCASRKEIIRAIRRLRAGGSTNGGQGIELAYATALKHFINGGVNRVILCTDGDFNVGVTSAGDLTRLITAKARSGVVLTVLGFGMGNYKDATLEKLADLGNGNYGYIDSSREARKLFVEQLNGTLVTVAKDVKLQVEFNPARVGTYRLIGYENRLLRKEEFNDDARDSGDIGAGHTVTAFYEIAPSDVQPVTSPGVDPLKYQPQSDLTSDVSEMVTVKVRYKQPDRDTSQLLSLQFSGPATEFAGASEDHKFASAVAAFGMVLRESEYKGSATFDLVLSLVGATDARAEDRAEFVSLVKNAKKFADSHRPDSAQSDGKGSGKQQVAILERTPNHRKAPTETVPSH